MSDLITTFKTQVVREQPGLLTAPMSLSPDIIHVHSTMLDAPPGRVAALREFLSDDERARADRFRFAREHNRYVIAHGWLRLVLASYLEMHPQAVRFAHNAHGKPHVENGPKALDLRFNLSHAEKVGLIAVSHGRALGVDVEQVRKNFPCLEAAEHFFSRTERAALADLPAALQHTAFFNAWTRKEAYIKAIGEGLSHPLADFDVSLAPDALPQLLATRPDPSEAARWTLHAFAPFPGYIAAIAAEGRDWGVQYFPPAS